MRVAEILTSLSLLLFAAYVVAEALRLSYGEGGIPGPGFAPLWIGLGLGAAAALDLGRALVAGRTSAPLVDAGALPPLLAISGITVAWVAVIPLLGMIVSLAAFVAAAAWALGMRRLRVLLCLMVLIPAGFYLVFDRWLGVPFPRGLLL